jgi:7-cyano-7-deazaguanine synthase
MTDSHSNAGVIGLLFSGGLDSGVLLGHLLRNGRRVRPFYVRSQLVWEEAERKAVAAILGVSASPALAPLVVLDMPLGDLYADHWSVTGRNTPQSDTTDDAVYLPGRNALLTLKPALWCAMHGIEELVLAVLKGNPFADATDDFFREFAGAISRATGKPLRFSRPFGQFAKKDVMALGRNMPLERTFSCIAPQEGLHCGRCNKCAERQNAFRSIDVDDPTEYVE